MRLYRRGTGKSVLVTFDAQKRLKKETKEGDFGKNRAPRICAWPPRIGGYCPIASQGRRRVKEGNRRPKERTKGDPRSTVIQKTQRRIEIKNYLISGRETVVRGVPRDPENCGERPPQIHSRQKIGREGKKKKKTRNCLDCSMKRMPKRAF